MLSITLEKRESEQLSPFMCGLGVNQLSAFSRPFPASRTKSKAPSACRWSGTPRKDDGHAGFRRRTSPADTGMKTPERPCTRSWQRRWRSSNRPSSRTSSSCSGMAYVGSRLGDENNSLLHLSAGAPPPPQSRQSSNDNGLGAHGRELVPAASAREASRQPRERISQNCRGLCSPLRSSPIAGPRRRTDHRCSCPPA